MSIMVMSHGGGPYRWRSMEESVREALSRKRRLRLIHKWRNGLMHTAQPKHGDRGKLSTIAAWRAMHPDPLMERVLGPMMDAFQAGIAERIMNG